MKIRRSFKIATHHLSIALLAMVLCLTNALAAAIPDGWKADSRIGVERYTSPDGAVHLEIVARNATEQSAAEYLKTYLDSLSKDLTYKTIQTRSLHDGEIARTLTTKGKRNKVVSVVKRPGKPFQLCTIWISKQSQNFKSYKSILASLINNADVPLGELRATRDKRIEREQIRRKLTTAPGDGLKASQIRGIAHILPDLKYDTFSGLFKERGGGYWLVLNDGSAYYSPTIAPSEFNVQKSRELEPKRWKVWENVKNNHKAMFFQSSKPGLQVSISASKTHSSGMPGTVSSATRYLKLTEDGRFETSKSSFTGSNLVGATTGSPGLGSTGSILIAGSEDKDGKKTTFGSHVITPNGGVSILDVDSSTSKNPNRSGRYYIDGHTIELRFDSGQVRRSVFGVSDNTILFDGVVYSG